MKVYCTPTVVTISLPDCALSSPLADADDAVRAAKARWALRRWDDVAFVERALTTCADDGRPVLPDMDDL